MSNLEEIKKRNENNSPNHLQHIVSIPFLTCNTNAKVREEKSLTLSNGVRSNLPKKKKPLSRAVSIVTLPPTQILSGTRGVVGISAGGALRHQSD